MSCINCGRGFHDECLKKKGCQKCHSVFDHENAAKSLGLIGRPIKNPEDVKDVQSTGRKRAAVHYPIFKNKPCEWRGKKNCGGGLYPITGCLDGMQLHRHHGPVKNTLRNEPGNVHRICYHCHNRWHAKNDTDYDEEIYETLSHSPEEASETELLANKAYWEINKL